MRVFTWVFALGAGALFATPAFADTIYSNLTPNNLIAIATRPDTTGKSEIEAADDFVVGSQTFINSASFIGIEVPGITGAPSVSEITAEMYRVFPLDSNTTRTLSVPTRANSPSDVAFASRDSGAGDLTFTTSVLSANLTVLNSVQPGGIHPLPGETTGGNGPLTGIEVEITLTFTTPFNLPANHYFFVPQVALTNGGEFYWLSASKPISGAGTTPLAPDLQVWTRDAALDPDWLRVGTDIVGGPQAPTFNAAFSLDGTTAAVPEPSSVAMIATALILICGIKRSRRMAR